MIRFAFEAPLPRVLIVLTNKSFPLSIKYFSENSLFTCLETFSIWVMIESVISSLVPLGITNSIEIRSDAMEGKKEVLMIPPPKDPIVNVKRAMKREIIKKRLFNENVSQGS